jgi:hypothetical protein
MEFCQIWFQDRWLVPGGIAGDHNGKKNVSTFGLHSVNHVGHFIQFIWANVWAMGETKIHLVNSSLVSQCTPMCTCLYSSNGKYHRTNEYFPFKSLSVKGLPSWSIRSKGPPTFGLPIPFVCSAIRFRSKRARSSRK